MAAIAHVSSRIHYCNSLFRSLSGLTIRILQSVQNSLASIITNPTRYPNGYPKWLSAFLIYIKTCIHTWSKQMNGAVLEMPQFVPSAHKSTRQHGFIFAYDVPKVRNEWASGKHTRLPPPGPVLMLSPSQNICHCGLVVTTCV